jgi:hypothetical protein
LQSPTQRNRELFCRNRDFFYATGNFQGGAGKFIPVGRGAKILFFGVDGVLKRHQVLRSDNRRRRLYLNE